MENSVINAKIGHCFRYIYFPIQYINISFPVSINSRDTRRFFCKILNSLIRSILFGFSHLHFHKASPCTKSMLSDIFAMWLHLYGIGLTVNKNRLEYVVSIGVIIFACNPGFTFIQCEMGYKCCFECLPVTFSVAAVVLSGSSNTRAFNQNSAKTGRSPPAVSADKQRTHLHL